MDMFELSSEPRSSSKRPSHVFRWCLRITVLLLLISFYDSFVNYEHMLDSDIVSSPSPQPQERCAICLYGLPRAFRTLVLPSLIQNVIIPNAALTCDYFVYYHAVAAESAGRSGAGGTVHATQVFALRDALRQHSPSSRLKIANFTNAQFQRERAPLLEKIHTTRSSTTRFVDNDDDPNGDLIYVPVREYGDNALATTDNIVKMWHGQEGVWKLMMEQQEQQQSTGRQHYAYTRVAMLRADVVFVTPIRVMMQSSKSNNNNNYYYYNNKVVVVPQFASFPVNDRAIIGPTEAVRVWAAERFALLDQHIQTILKQEPGIGIHDEKYLYYTVFPEIQQRGFEIRYDKDICFLRARADESVWATDCGVVSRNRKMVQTLVGHACRGTWLDPSHKKKTVVLQCSNTEDSSLPDDWTTHRPQGIYLARYYVTQWKRRMGIVD